MSKMGLKKGETNTKSLKFREILRSYPNIFTADRDVYEEQHRRHSSASSPRISYYASSDEATTTPYKMSPWNEHSSPYNKSPWSIIPSRTTDHHDDCFGLSQNGLICSLVRGEGHVYSLAVSDDLLYTGSESNNIRVWKNMGEFSGFKSSSGLVKAIVICGDKVFTGHQDGKIRVWKNIRHNPSFHKRIGTLPTVKDFIKTSMNRKNYVEVRRQKRVVWNRHFDAVSCLSLDHDHGLLYSGSWDKTIKVWRISDFKCLESITAHDDAINSITTVGFCDLVFSGSADGKVKVWGREKEGSSKIKHGLVEVLLKQESAVTSLVVNQSKSSPILYCGSSDGLINFWVLKAAAREKMQLTHGGVLKGHQSAVLCLATGEDLIFSGSADRSICVWKRHEDGFYTCLSVLSGHTGPVKCLAVEEEDGERNGRWIVYSGSLDMSVKVWRVSADLPAAMEFVDNGKDATKELVDADSRRFYSMIIMR